MVTVFTGKCAGLLGELLENCAQRTRRGDALRERQPQAHAFPLQIKPFRIAADAAPVAVGGAEELPRIEPASLGVIGIHVRDRIGLGLDLTEFVDVGADVLEFTSRLIERKLADFGVSAKVLAAYPGPGITRYEVEPAVGVKGSQVVNLVKDLARGRLEPEPIVAGRQQR